MTWLGQNTDVLLNSFAVGLLLFMMAVGLTIVFGLLDVLNLAHGSFFLAGAYTGYRIAGETTTTMSGFLLAIVVAAFLGALLGVALMALVAPLLKRGHLDQALLTLGLSLVVGELLLEIFGKDEHAMAAPPALAGSIEVGAASYPVYRLAVIAIGAIVAVAVWWVLEKTPGGALLRATVADREMVEAVGVDVRRVTLVTFAAATALAVISGVLAGPVKGASSGLDDEMLMLALVVIVIGGLGSVLGTLAGSLIIGFVQNLGVILAPGLASFTMFGAMLLVLAFKPRGLIPSTATAAR